MPKIIAKHAKLLYASIFFFILFYSFSFLFVKGGGLNGFDFNMTVRIQDHIPRKFDPYFSFLSLLGSFEVTVVALAAFLFIRRRVHSVMIVFIFCFMHIVELVGKAFLDHPPTPFMFHRYSFDVVFPTSYVQPGGSYPSGHAMRTMFLAILLCVLIYRTKKLKMEMKYALWAAVVVFTILMGISRISLGEHWTTDVIGGSFLGAAFSFFSLIFV
ncbi:MAG TPA: phosphatase PAP2 family protein [Patescibacteria group bacterium]|nr:phosphatase PAP2 family protein [Patescibacteria group bacterium]